MFVHSLVRVTEKDKHGWKAPVELGERTPHYVSFVIPLSRENEVLDEYTCEVVKIDRKGRNLETHKLKKSGTDSFVLELPHSLRIWFHVRGVGRDGRRLHYLGKLRHDDFQNPLTEIEPSDNTALDRLCEDQHFFIVGCDPELHYVGVAHTEHHLT